MSVLYLVIVFFLIVIVVLWYLLRPERGFISKTVDEEFPGTIAVQTSESEGQPKRLYSGSFHDVAHETKGTASIYQLPDGKQFLPFMEFETSNGPDLQVYLVDAGDSNDNNTLKDAGFIHLAALKGSVGEQNYDLPSYIDYIKYKAVTIWCRRFGVNFGKAPLKPNAS